MNRLLGRWIGCALLVATAGCGHRAQRVEPASPDAVRAALTGDDKTKDQLVKLYSQAIAAG